MKKALFIFFITVVLTLAIVVGLTHIKIEEKLHLDAPILLTVESGSSFNQFTQRLVKEKIIETRFWLRNYVRIHRKFANIKAGTYQITPEQTVKSLLIMINKGAEHQFSITFVEGTSLKQWLELLAKTDNIEHRLPTIFTQGKVNQYAVSYVNDEKKEKALQALAQQFNIDAVSPEGYFYPDTYAFSAGDSDVDILQRAHNKMLVVLDKLWLNRNPNLPYENKQQALTMASIIEKESGEYAEQDIIASVFINRLDKKMRLQTDPTVIYGLGERYQGDIKSKHLREVNQYNTRKIKGFPLTPIAMPGEHALQAAFYPASSDYLYFVSNGKGQHVFSKTLKAHNAAVKLYLKHLKK